MTPIRLVALVLLVALAPWPALASPADDAEVEQGRRYARELEKEYTVVTDPAVVERLSRIGRELAALSDRPSLPWSFKAVEERFPNAVALPGGFIYLTTGMLGVVRTDHELAAVLAHEITHVAHRHHREMERRGSRASFYVLLIAALSRDPAIAAAAQLLAQGIMASFTKDLERDADIGAIGLLTRTRYSPVGVLTVMERLAREERLTVTPDPGAFRDHPRMPERVAYVEADLRRRGIGVIRRIPAGYLAITTRVSGDVGELLVDGRPVMRLSGGEARLRDAAVKLDFLFNAEMQPVEVAAREFMGETAVVGRGLIIVTITRADAALASAPPAEVGRQIAAALRAAIEASLQQRRFQGRAGAAA